MSGIQFIYMNNKYSMKLKEKNKLNYEELESYSKILGKDLDELYFSYNGRNLNIKNARNIIFKERKNKIKIFVFILTKKKAKQEFSCITCPKCKNLAQLKINEDSITIDNCIKKHYYADLTINEFTLSQNIEDSSVKCDFCGNSKNYYSQFYLCSCGKLICPFCYLLHDLRHTFISYDNRFYQCNKHSLEFIMYCTNCNINLCSMCERDHYKHKIIYYKSMQINDKKKLEMKKEFKDLEIKVDLFKKELIKLNAIYSDFILNINHNLDEYLKLNEHMSNCLENLKNYENIINVLNFKTKKLNRDMHIILSQPNSKNKFKHLLEIFDNPKNELSLEYNINNANDSKIRLFGEKFVKTNKNNCFLLINGERAELKEFYYLDDKPSDNIIKVDLIEKKKISNMSNMFSECNNLSNLDISKFDTSYVTNINGMFSDCNLLENIPNDISKINTSNITNMSYLFYNCEKIKNLPDISKWETFNMTNINHMFNKCSNLLYIPDISKWNTSKVKDFSAIFNECSSLKSLPEINKWDTKNAISMNGMFNKCSNLLQLPDISKWNLSNVKEMSAMFQSCSSLKYLPNFIKWNISNVNNISGIFNKCISLVSFPDISYWNLSNVIDMSAFFQNCSNLASLPNISKWNISKVKNISYIFNECISLTSIPDISKWRTNNVNEMVGIFSNCFKLLQLPDISKWNTERVKNMGHIFNGCSSLISIPDISKWNTDQVTYMSSMFQNCSSLKSIPDISKWNVSKVTDISYLFNKCSKLEKIPNLSKWNTENVKNMSYLFNECPLLKNLKNIVSKWNTKNLIKKKNIYNENYYSDSASRSSINIDERSGNNINEGNEKK